MTLQVPESVPVKGWVEAIWVPAIADLDAPTVTEITAGVSLGCYSPEQWEGLTKEAQVTEETRMCLVDNYETIQRINRGISDFTLTVLPQALAEAGNGANEAYEALTENSLGNVVVRYGKLASEPVASGDVVDVQPAKVATRTKNTTTQNEGGPQTFTANLLAQPGFREDVTVAAAA